MNEDDGKTFGKAGAFSLGPGIGAAVLAKASCPVCYPAIGGFLTSIGLGFLFQGVYLYLLMGLFFGISLFGLAFKAKSRRGYAPFWLGVLGVIVGMLGKYISNDIIFYIGIGILIVAAIWNLIPYKQNCTSCAEKEIDHE